MALNVFGQPLAHCCLDPVTGFFRDGFCKTGAQDAGSHVICACITPEFLEFTLGMGNDLITPKPAADFPGLKPGDKWCICAIRWKEAYEAGVAPPVFLASTHYKALNFVDFGVLAAYAIDKEIYLSAS